MQAFDPQFIALSGDAAALGAITQRFGVAYTRIDLPGGIVRKQMCRPFRRLQAAKASRVAAEWIGAAQHRLDADEVFDRNR